MEFKRIATCAERIKTALSIRGMKQAELCRRVNMPKSSLSQYLSGLFEPKQDRVYDMAMALNVNEAWLMGYDVPMEKQSPEKVEILKEAEELVSLFLKAPKNKQQLVLQMVRVILENQE